MIGKINGNRIWIVYVTLLVFSLLISGLISKLNNGPEDVDIEKDKLFVEYLEEPLNINQDLEISSNISRWNVSNPDSLILTIRNISKGNFLLLNDSLANLRIYRFDYRTKIWSEVFLHYHAFPDQVTLHPQNNEGRHSEITIELDPKYVDIQNQDDCLRFYVIAFNNDTYEMVSAFIDIEIIQE